MKIDELSERYYGDLARSYEEHRKHSRAWKREEAIVRGYLEGIPAGATLIDVPVGTGRFAGLYREQALQVTGVDASRDMLGIAAEKGKAEGLDWQLQQGNIKELPFSDNTFHTAVCMRFLNWVESSDVAPVVGELARVSSEQIVLGVKLYVRLRDIELLSPQGLKRTLMQAKRRFYMARGRRDFVYHSRHTFDHALALSGLSIVEQALVQHRKDGIDYYVYRLRRDGGGAGV